MKDAAVDISNFRIIKVYKKSIVFFQLLLLLGTAPYLMGQQSCQVQESLLETLNGFSKRFQPQATGSHIYISQLSFIDVKTKEIVAETNEVRLINEAVQQGIRQAEKVNPSLKFNADGHEIKNTSSNVNRLTAEFYNANRTPDENMTAVINDFMDPENVDVIITGQYMDNDTVILVKPLLISKQDRKQVAKMLRFNKDEYICGDALCVNAYESISKAVKDLLDSL